MELVPTIGLEIHAELKTRTKMFCRSLNDPDAAPNTNICPVCMAHPGTLPTINEAAVRHVLRVGLAVGGALADYTEFDRKNYFYPDLPKGYQLSQFEYPLVSGGALKGVELTRIHLEEDTARSAHDAEKGETLIDYNRAGVPLMELVTEPVIHDAEAAGAFARELRLLLRYLGAGSANMEKGEMRVEANISVGPKDGPLGTKVEVKNLNSFRSVERAIAYEIERQKALLAEGGEVVQETRGWDETTGKTFSQRAKEGSADYRYFPDPDLPSLRITEIEVLRTDSLKKTLPQLPWERRGAYEALGLGTDTVEMFVRDTHLADFFDAVCTELGNADADSVRTAANYISGDLVSLIRDIDNRDTETESEITIPVSSNSFAELIRMIARNDISSRGAKDILAVMVNEGGEPGSIADAKGLRQSSSEEDLLPMVQQIIAEHAAVAEEYRGGKEASLQFLVGQGMKASKGSANPAVLKELLIRELQK